MTQDDKNARLKKAWTRRYNEMLKAGFSEAMARMEADDYVAVSYTHLRAHET